MTNKELIERFFKGWVYGDEESYGFSVKPLLRGHVGTFALFSKTLRAPMAVRPSEYYFIVTTPLSGADGRHYKNHNRLVITIAKQLKIRSVFSPLADKANFHEYMEEKINKRLWTLANDLRIGSYASVLRSTEVDSYKPKYALANKPESLQSVPENYQKLMENINTLLEGERVLELPKNQVSLLDTDEVQSLWGWLIKESPIKEDRKLLREMYMLSKLMAPHREEKKGGLIMMSNPRR